VGDPLIDPTGPRPKDLIHDWVHSPGRAGRRCEAVRAYVVFAPLRRGQELYESPLLDQHRLEERPCLRIEAWLVRSYRQAPGIHDSVEPHGGLDREDEASGKHARRGTELDWCAGDACARWLAGGDSISRLHGPSRALTATT